MEKTKNLLSNVKTLTEYQKKIEKIKGENFNVFSILKMESKENETHSAFLGELLNPKGSHNQGSKFLELFLEIIGYYPKIKTEAAIEKTKLNIRSAKLKLEHSIGRRNDIKKVGGRVDIYIYDEFKKSICIENKIYASDQNTQVERYCNHNKKKNCVYYLTLFGNDPSKKSMGLLKSGTDFFNISYQNEIIDWLESCTKEAVHLPILRESIKQYIILLKKLTNNMNTEEEIKLKKVIFEDLESATTIVNNYNNFIFSVKKVFRDICFDRLKNKLDSNEFNVSYPKDKNNIWQTWITLKEFDENEHIKHRIWFGIEPFSGYGPFFGGDLFVGIIDFMEKESSFKFKGEYSMINEGWIAIKKIEYHNNPINLSKIQFLKLIHDPSTKVFNDMVDIVCETSINFILENKEQIKNYYNSLSI